MLAHDIMTTDVVTIDPDASVPEIAKLLIENGISAAPVVDAAGKLVGIVSEGDLVHRVRGDQKLPRSWWLTFLLADDSNPKEYVRSHGSKASDVMTRDVVTVAPDAPVAEIAGLMESEKIKRIPVIESGKLVGIVSRANIIQALVGKKPGELPSVAVDDKEIREKILDEFLKHGWSSTTQINVLVTDGVVRLWGFVRSDDALDAVRVVCESVPGVKEIDSQLTVAAKVPDYI